MKKFSKSSYSMYLKNLKTLYPDNSSVRSTLGIYDRITHREFKMVLPLYPKENVAMKGSDAKPKYDCIESMNVMINCLKRSDYNENSCLPEITAFNNCFMQYKTKSREAAERNRTGIYEIAENQSQFPVKFMQKMLAQYKTPKKIDDGPNIPVNKIK